MRKQKGLKQRLGSVFGGFVDFFFGLGLFLFVFFVLRVVVFFLWLGFLLFSFFFVSGGGGGVKSFLSFVLLLGCFGV